MLFNSPQFAVFFPIVTLLYFLLPRSARVPMLLAASCVFYMAFVPRYILILAVLIVIDYSAGLLIERTSGHRRRALLIASLSANVGMLGFFKYFNFFNVNVAGLAQFIGWRYSISSLKIVLPIGLSFHTFQSMSYTIEVYRGRFRAERSLLYFALYVMFYPQLVAGPIERPQNLMHQFREVHRFEWTRVFEGLQLMFSGLFLKMVIADRARVLVDAVYTAPHRFSGAQLIVATIFFAVQIYCDFCGYSQIARGAAKVMGFDLMLNFNRPYLAASIADFWRRWHISLSTWFRDYLYFPLGGNRRAIERTCFNLGIVFLVSGLWHGASWTFIVWGAIHAVFIIGYVLSGGIRTRAAGLVGQRTMRATGWLATMAVVVVAWVFFRAVTVSDAFFIVKTMVLHPAPRAGMDWHPGLDSVQFGIAVALTVGLLTAETVAEFRDKPLWAVVGDQPRWRRWSTYYALFTAFVVLLILAPEHGAQPFIYFQF